jgi:hypothetical protein
LESFLGTGSAPEDCPGWETLGFSATAVLTLFVVTNASILCSDKEKSFYKLFLLFTEYFATKLEYARVPIFEKFNPAEKISWAYPIFTASVRFLSPIHF